MAKNFVVLNQKAEEMLLLLLFLFVGGSCINFAFAEDPLLINHKNRRRSTVAHDFRSLNFNFDVEPSNTIISQDGSALLQCKFTIISNNFLPPDSEEEITQKNKESNEDISFTTQSAANDINVKTEWRKDGSPIHPIGRFNLLPNGSFLLENAVIADEGQYQCVVHVTLQSPDYNSKETTWTYLSKRAFLALPYLHRFEQHPADQHVRVGQSAAFRCLLDSKPTPLVEWYHDSHLLTSGEDGFLVLPISQTLELRNVKPRHAGVYKCVVRNGERSRTSQLSTLTVLEGLESTQSMNWVLEPRNQLVTVGESVLLECLANNGGSQQVTQIKWLHNGEQIDSREFGLVGQNNSTHLLIHNISTWAAGKYICRAHNPWRTLDVSAIVAVRVPPTITTGPIDIVTQETNDVEFECISEGVPTPRITWFKNGEVIIPSEYFVIASGKLRIFGLVKDDQGVYQCLADNEVGSAQAAGQLLVDKAEVLSSYYSLLNRSTHKPIPEHGLDPANLSSGPRRRNPTSHLPLVSSPVDPQTPQQPLSLRALEVHAQRITLKWDQPLSQAHSPISHYIIYYREEGSTRERSANTSGSETTITLRGLQPETAYSIRTVALNRAGPGKSSEILRATTPKKQFVPGPVNNLRAQVLSSESIQVEWDEPNPVDEHSNEDIRYKLFYAITAGNGTKESGEGKEMGIETQVLMLKTTYTLHGLAKNTLYAIRVEAENVLGSGESSEMLFVKTLPDVPSAPPQGLRLDPVRPNAVRVQWVPPPREHWNGELTGYKVRYKVKSRPGTKANTVVVEGRERSTHVLEGLGSGTDYLVRVAAVNKNGTGPWTDWTEVATMGEEREETQIAGAPSELRVHATHEAVHVSWLPPHDNNVLIRGYLIGWGVNIPDVEKTSVDPNIRQYVIRGLKANREYVISLRAFNKVGQGFPIYETVKTSFSYASASADADPTNSFASFGQPVDEALLTPVGVQAEAISSSQIRLSWSDPNEHAFNQLYTMRYGLSGEEPTKKLNTTETEHMFEGLKPNTQYEFAVRLAHSPHWSLNTINRTLPAPPSSPPRDLTIIGPQSERDEPGTLSLNWQPPKYANGEIQEYIVLYSSQPNLADREWVMDSVKGDRLSMSIHKLRPGFTYHFKLQARNVKGYGPFTAVASFTLPVWGRGLHQFDGSIVDGGGNDASGDNPAVQLLRANLALVLIGVVSIILLLLAIALTALCIQRTNGGSRTPRSASQRKHSDRHSKQAYTAGRKHSISTPPTVDDLWIHQNSGGRFAALVNTTAGVEDFDVTSAVNGGANILLIDGQQRAFIAPGAGTPALQHVADSPTPPCYQSYNRQECDDELRGTAEEDEATGSSVPHSMAESFHSMVGSPKHSANNRRQHRNSLPSRICPSSSISPMIGNKSAAPRKERSLYGGVMQVSRKSASPLHGNSFAQSTSQRVATVRMKNGISKNSLNMLETPYDFHQSSSSPASKNTLAGDEKCIKAMMSSTFVGGGVPSLGLRVKHAKRAATANYMSAEAKKAPVKCVNFASKLVIVGAEEDTNGGNREEEIAFIDDDERCGDEDCAVATTPKVVGTLSRAAGISPYGQNNHHNSATSLEMKNTQPLLHNQKSYHQLTPATPRNAHVVYTRVDRQPIAKVDFSMDGGASGVNSVSPYEDGQQRQHFFSTPPPSLDEAQTKLVNDGYQTVRGLNAGTSMRSFANGVGGHSIGPQQHPHQQQRAAHVVRPIVYAANASTSSPSTLRSAIGQTLQQKATPTIVHKFGGGNANVPVGRATAQPRVNIAAEAAINNNQNADHAHSPYSSVRNGGQEEEQSSKAKQQQVAKSDGSTEDLNVHEIDQMIDTLQQIQQELTDGT